MDARQAALLQAALRPGGPPGAGVTMSRGKPVQEGVRVKLPKGVTLGQARAT